MLKTPVSVIILTYNEEVNIKFSLESVKDLTDDIFIVDSFSTDKTLEIARHYTDKIFQNPWTHYAGQRQWALANLPLKHDWILFLDADERLTSSLKTEIYQVVTRELENPHLGGYYVPRHFFFLGRQLNWGGYQAGLKELRLSNRNYLILGERAGHEIYISKKGVGSLKEPMIHEDKKPLSAWVERHNYYSTLNANYLWSLKHGKDLFKGFEKSTPDRHLYWKEKLRKNLLYNLPIGFRPTLLFIYRYFFKLGFLDGMAGFIYILLHEFWFNFLIDAKYIELKRNRPVD